MFALPPGDGDAQPEGATNERPINIPGVKASEFRNLLKMPSDKLFINLQGRNGTKTGAWSRFIFLSDVARLANRFCMTDVEKWAVNQLRCLMQSAGYVAAGARAQPQDGIPYTLLATLWYTGIIQDVSLGHHVRNVIQHYCIVPTSLSSPGLLAFFHNPQLRQKDPSLFGFLFITLLNLGHKTWGQKHFTREDRVAFFSAQSYLTPLPRSLGKDLNLPILVRPRYTEEGHVEVFEDMSCSDKCYHWLSTAWNRTIGWDYYRGVLSSEMLQPTTQLGLLPSLRLHFANAIRPYHDCGNDCCSKALEWLDEDIYRLFAKLSCYYRGID
ncbi:hypothetical protein FRC08_013719 [Ceratobasidium sp. 394]|nr:hypothetical protein FRC08_013719 [Ceratobasidium sp. 394]